MYVAETFNTQSPPLTVESFVSNNIVVISHFPKFDKRLFIFQLWHYFIIQLRNAFSSELLLFSGTLSMHLYFSEGHHFSIYLINNAQS